LLDIPSPGKGENRNSGMFWVKILTVLGLGGGVAFAYVLPVLDLSLKQGNVLSYRPERTIEKVRN